MTSEFQNEPIAVLGLGKSGFESARFLHAQGARVWVSESKSSPEMLERKAALESLGIAVELGMHSPDRILSAKRVIMSPGIPPSSAIYQSVRKNQIPIWSEIELASRFCPADIVAVTGTSGKTTVTTLLGEIFRANGYPAIVCGNIGNPMIGEAAQWTKDSIVVLEVSSFQLENIDTFRPHVALLLNLSDNHLDWHGSFDAYASAKWNVFRNQTRGDYALVNAKDLESVRRAAHMQAQKVYFNGGETDNPNWAACLAVSGIYRLDERKTKSVWHEFRGIEHRMETVPSQDGLRYINDSKSTSIASLKWALERMDRKVILIAGGRHKGGDFSALADLVSEKVRFLVAIGEAAPLIEKTFQSATRVLKVSSLDEAVRHARAVASAGDTILFSPACASFDMFRNYEERGRRFKELVHAAQPKAAGEASALAASERFVR